jgi:hypothetical protein
MKFMMPASIETKHFIFHPLSYGIATLMRIGIVFHGRKLMIHHFLPHQETEFHDHPWSFRTLVLLGGYWDESPCPNPDCDRGMETYVSMGPMPDVSERECSLCHGSGIIVDILRRGDRRFRPALHAHRTSCTCHTWTLVFTSRKQRTWCKGTPETWICGGEVADFDALRGMVRIEDR